MNLENSLIARLYDKDYYILNNIVLYTQNIIYTV